MVLTKQGIAFHVICEQQYFQLNLF